MQEYKAFFQNYVNFSDRTNRRGYWMAFLINFVITLVLQILARNIGFFGIISGLYGLAVLVPGIAITIRRLRDSGKPWYWIFISLIPIIGAILLLVFLAKDSIPDDGTPVV